MNVLDISKYIVPTCLEDNRPISNLQLQKILYYVQQEFLNRGKTAFFDDIEAWQIGPVVPKVFYHFCGFGSMPITITDLGSKIPSDYKGIIGPIVREKRELKPWDLVSEVHYSGGPWDLTYQSGKGARQVIPVRLIGRDTQLLQHYQAP